MKANDTPVDYVSSTVGCRALFVLLYSLKCPAKPVHFLADCCDNRELINEVTSSKSQFPGYKSVTSASVLPISP